MKLSGSISRERISSRIRWRHHAGFVKRPRDAPVVSLPIPRSLRLTRTISTRAPLSSLGGVAWNEGHADDLAPTRRSGHCSIPRGHFPLGPADLLAIPFEPVGAGHKGCGVTRLHAEIPLSDAGDTLGSLGENQ